jgi:hypothetical protein
MRTLQHLPAFALFGLCPAAVIGQCSTVFTEDTAVVYLGYEPLSCAELVPWVTGNGPYTYGWSTGASTPTITACADVPDWYAISTTDADGCVSGDSILVRVVDVRCGNNLNKVAVCHIPPGNPANAHTICISENGVPAHLAHGCTLGACAADTLGTDSMLEAEVDLVVAPNPVADDAYVQLVTTAQESVLVTLVDGMGRTRSVLYSGIVPPSTPLRWALEPGRLTGELFWVRCTTESGKSASAQVLRLE